jgi:hypothetical protein
MQTNKPMQTDKLFQEVAIHGPGWVQSIRNLDDLDRKQRVTLLDLMVKFIVQRFTRLSEQEIEEMLKLTLSCGQD